MATISACAVGSLAEVTRLVPVATISSSPTITAAKGPPWPVRTLATAISIARAINRCCIPRLSLIATQRFDRIDRRRFSCWKNRSEESAARQDHRRTRQNRRIVPGDAVQFRADEAAHGQGDRNSGGETEADQKIGVA